MVYANIVSFMKMIPISVAKLITSSAEKHDGSTEAENLAYACVYCNRSKGSDIGSISWQTNQFVRFYNPRIDQWINHFRIEGVVIKSLSDIGEATERILGFNNPERLLERDTLQGIGRYPSQEASIFLSR